jgi:hypothetical protein
MFCDVKAYCRRRPTKTKKIIMAGAGGKVYFLSAEA